MPIAYKIPRTQAFAIPCAGDWYYKHTAPELQNDSPSVWPAPGWPGTWPQYGKAASAVPVEIAVTDRRAVVYL